MIAESKPERMREEGSLRAVSIEGCEVIGEGRDGKVCRLDRDSVVKTYEGADALSRIRREIEVLESALGLGVPAAPVYEVVKAGDGFGVVFKLPDGACLASSLTKEPERMEFFVREYVKLLRRIHDTAVPEGKYPSMRLRLLRAVDRLKEHLPEEVWTKLKRMTEAIPESDRLVLGDFRPENVVVSGREAWLLDVTALSTGRPVFDLALAYVRFAFPECDPEISGAFRRAFLPAFLGTADEDRLKEAEEKISVLSYVLLIDRALRRRGADRNEDAETAASRIERLKELITKVDTLSFDMELKENTAGNELDVEAERDRLETVTEFVNRGLEAAGASMKTVTQIDIAVEEIFVNIASYAYHPGKGRAFISAEVSGEPPEITIVFKDRGVPYDPLKKQDPDTTLAASEREIGGLGIFMTKKIMDSMSYEYKDGQNVLTMKKKLS